MKALLALSLREWRRFVRQPSRVVATVGTPALVWVFAASGMSGSFTGGVDGGVSYAGFLLPGMVTMTILFSTIFASISLIQDRQAGFLQSALVSPAPVWAIVGSKVIGGTVIATGQAAALLTGSWAVGLSPGVGGYCGAVLAAALTAAGVIGLGLSAAWWINSSSGFHGVMNMALLPMWLLSGGLFPVEGASRWMRWLVRINPMHWSTAALSGALGIRSGSGGGDEGVWPWIGATVFAAAMVVMAGLIMARRSTKMGSEAAE